jgi:arylsulfatase A-like enzyme
MRLTRRKILAGAGALAATAAGFPFLVSRRPRRRENVFLIVVGAMRGDCIGRTVNGREVTPTLNRLAARGVCFQAAFSAAASTKTSVPSILSGMYPPGHGVEYNFYTLPDCMTIPRYLSAKGYASVGVVANPFLAPETGPGLANVGFGNSFDCYRALGIEDAIRDKLLIAPADRMKFVAYPDGRRVNEVFFRLLDGAENFHIDARKPLFAYLHYMDTHQPWLGPQPIWGITGCFHSSRKPGLPTAYDINARLVNDMFFASPPKRTFTPDELEDLKAIYLEAAAYADSCVGELMGELAVRGLWKDATVILTAGHGDELMEHGCLGHSQNLYNTVLHVPLIITGKGIAPSSVAARVSNAMVLSTLMEFFGDEEPSANVGSLGPYFGGATPGNATIYAGLRGWAKAVTPDGRAVIRNEARTDYFDLTSDPAESRPSSDDNGALAVLEKTRYQSAALAREAGVVKRFSTYPWQNPWAAEQEQRAAELVKSGTLSAAEASRLKTMGYFLPDSAREAIAKGGDADLPASDGAMTPELKAQLKALGYLN